MLGAAKHQIERAWRFTDNDRVETADAMRPIIQRLLKRRKAKLPVALDWVDVTGFQTLMASAVLRGRPFDSAQGEPERFDRFMLILAIASLTLSAVEGLLCGVGPIAKATLCPAEWCSTTRPTECSIYTIGLIMRERITASPQQALAAAMRLSELVSPSWG